jgi:nucleoside 2-deoxyribosyltransferase
MIIHFIATITSLEENIESFRLIAETLKSQGHTLARDWMDEAHRNIQDGKSISEDKWQAFIEEDFSAIAKADVVIADITFDSTAIGYQVATAVQQKKPTLLILRDDTRTPSFTWNIPSEFLSKVDYNQSNVVEKITPFLSDNDISTKDMRFNFFIDRPIYNYLRWAALKTGKTKAEILRELVQREIKEKDY